MASFTGSTETGVLIAETVAPHSKHLVQELGGKSPYMVLDDAVIKANDTPYCLSAYGQGPAEIDRHVALQI